jgi:hypothetical protein
MVKSVEILKEIQQALSEEDWKIVDLGVNGIDQSSGKRAHKQVISDINNQLVQLALQKNKPEILFVLPDISGNDIDEIFSKILNQYITTQDTKWLNIVYSISEKLGKKSYQSRVFALMARDLIDAGVTLANQKYIDQGMCMLDQIGFRKYRSGIMIEIIPLIIVWAITTRNDKILRTSLQLIEEIGDISKRSVLHSELAKALVTIAILEKNRDLFLESVLVASRIHQKVKRHKCVIFVIEKSAKSQFGKELTDISTFIKNFKNVGLEEQQEIVSALSNQLLDKGKDKEQNIGELTNVCEAEPRFTSTIVIALLKKAEHTGDSDYLSSALKIQQKDNHSTTYPVRELVKAGCSIARQSNNMQILRDLLPFITNHCNSAGISKIYLQFSQIMLLSGDLSSAVEIYAKIDTKNENITQYTEALQLILREGVIKDRIPLISSIILQKINPEFAQNAIQRTTVEICKDFPVEQIARHIQAISDLVRIHPNQDSLYLESVAILVDRGFLNSYDPVILIRLANSINDLSVKERAISNIVIKIAKIGVHLKNRDFIQRAVGLTCEIDGQSTRSTTLSSIIDEVAILAAQQGDLDLLLRMKAWSSSLLENDLVAYAMANIVDGIIKYAIDKNSPESLEEAYLIARDISDPALKAQLYEKIAECFVKIGCSIFSEAKNRSPESDFKATFYPYERGMEITRQNIKNTHISLKIAGMIDILISYSRTSDNLDFIIPLAQYAMEIENPYERDAMISRIISNLNEAITHPDSSDPYEIVVYLLKKNELRNRDPVVIDLIFRILHQANDPFVKLTGLCNLAEITLKKKNLQKSSEILKSICQILPQLPSAYQKIQILCDLITIFSRIDTGKSRKCLSLALELLSAIEPERDSSIRRQLVFTIISLNESDPDKKLISLALEISEKIYDPVEYIATLIALYRFSKNDTDKSRELLHQMTETVKKIPTPYEKASTLLDIIPLLIQNGDTIISLALLKEVNEVTRQIHIQYIVDTIRNTITGYLVLLYSKSNEPKDINYAIEIAKTIDSDTIRIKRLKQLGLIEPFEYTPQYVKIRSLSEKIITTGCHPTQLSSLERLVRSVADRGKEALFFCDLAIFFKKKGEDRLARRMMQSAIKEAGIIRPLSHRAFVICDIAMKTYAAGCERTSQKLLDHAIDAATNIRQSSLRDDVFDELGLAIKIMQEIEP